MNAIRFVLPVVAAAITTVSASAQTATQDVSFEVQAISQIAFTGSPSLVISSATSGSAPNSATANATYAITTNETGRKVTASIDSDMPAGATLSVALAAPTGGTTAGAVVLSSTAADVVSGISTLSESGLSVTYTLEATAAAGVLPASTRTVTYTIVAGA